jgi:hypothetical protein
MMKRVLKNGWDLLREKQLKFAVATASVACLLNAFYSVDMLETVSLKWLGHDGATSHIQRVEKLLEAVPDDVVYLGYLSDEEKIPGPWNDSTARFARFLLSQFAAAPRILYPSSRYEWVIAQPEYTYKDLFLQQYSQQFEFVGDNGKRLMLLKRR